MRNDHKNIVTHDSSLNLETFYASGQRGPEARATGHGGLLARGYYGRTPLTGIVGPFSCRKTACTETSFKYRDAYQLEYRT